jgi:hypothetical protein
MSSRVITNRSAALISNLRGTEVYPLKEGNIKNGTYLSTKPLGLPSE